MTCKYSEDWLEFLLDSLWVAKGYNPEREVRGSRPTAAVLCPWARHFTPRKYWLITQEAMAPSRYDWKIVDWDVKPQHNQPRAISFFKGTVKTDQTADQMPKADLSLWWDVEVILQVLHKKNLPFNPMLISGWISDGY